MKLPITLANTIYFGQGEICDALTTTGDLVAWLRAARPHMATVLTRADLAAVSDDDLARAQALRDAIRAAASAVSTGRSPRPTDIETINAAVRAAPSWRELHRRHRLQARWTSTGRGPTAALAEVAQAAVDLLASADVRACQAPNCVLYFVRDHPRREWCSQACGNRARVARHYARHRSDPSI